MKKVLSEINYPVYRFLAFYAVAVPSVISILFNKHKEPLFSYKCLLLYLLRRGFFPLNKQKDFRHTFTFQGGTSLPSIIHNSDTYFFPASWSKKLVMDYFNGVLNEQNIGSPHRYLAKDEIKEGWVIYDIGCAEGLQAKQWTKKAKMIVIFEPNQEQCRCLEKTFESEIKKGKVKIVPEGVSDSYKELTYGETTITVDSLPNLIKKYHLPQPNYLKADIEGEEMNLLRGAKEVFKHHQFEVAQITTYHRPHDLEDIPAFFSHYKGKGHFSEGVTLVNRSGLPTVIFTFYHPIIRKCLYTYKFG